MSNRMLRCMTMAAVLAMAVIAPRTVLADNPKVNLDTFQPSLHPGDLLDVRTSSMAPHLDWSVGAWLTYNRNPLKLVDTNGADLYQAVKDQVVMDIYGSLAIFDRLDIALAIPIVMLSKGDGPPAGLGLDQASGAGLGDIRLGLKGRILGGNGRGFGLALSEDLTFPTSTSHNFAGDDNVTSTTRLIADWTKKGWAAALNVGFLGRKTVDVKGFDFGNEFLLGLGGQFPFLCEKLEGIATMDFRLGVGNPSQKYEQGLDFMAGLRGYVGPVTLLAAAGAGALQGYGSPQFRFTANVAYSPKPVEKGCIHDRDGDGTCDADDRCPDDPGPAELKGCPDRDHDGIADIDDDCPDVPGVPEFKGCPDTDRDGIPDKDDLCPLEPGPAKYLGCPDTDGDGIIDKEDKCPKEPGPAATGGCPDQDGDGIPDKDDACPTIYGRAEFKGCPPPTPKNVKLTEGKIEILEMVFFDFNKATIKKVSYGILNDVATVLKDNPNIKKIEVQGHTDNIGKPDFNLNLSQKRAESVVQYLVEKGGVAADRLTAKGFGDTKPIADNATKDGQAKNRRVEFVILQK